jgi:CBS domain-containing protein
VGVSYLLARFTVGATMTKGRLVGIVTETDFLRAFVALSEQAVVLP